MKKAKYSIGIWSRLPSSARKILTRLKSPLWFGTLYRTTPVSNAWGKDRGTPVDRYYIERFLQHYRGDIRGKVLEVGSRIYTDKFGVNVDMCDVLDNNPANPQATILTDLELPANIQSSQFDCLIFTQVLQFIYNVHGCISELHRILKPGGVLLATLPCVSRIDPSYGQNKDYWRFTTASCEKLFGKVFGKSQLDVQAYGNVFSSIAFLTGAASEELSQKDLDIRDPLFQLLIGIRVVKEQ